MRIRLTALTLGLYLSFALLGCNKPAAPAGFYRRHRRQATTAVAGSGESSSGGWLGFGHVQYSNVEHEARGAEGFGCPRGHRVDGPPRTIGWLQDQLSR